VRTSYRAARIAALFVIITASAAMAQTPDAELKLIDRLKRTRVSSLAIPGDESFDRWVTRLLGRSVTWEVNDCGEGGDGRIAPICVEVASETPKLYLWILVADTKGKAAPPQLFEGSVQVGSENRDIKRLADLPALVLDANGTLK
jgi:hypothetical protein